MSILYLFFLCSSRCFIPPLWCGVGNPTNRDMVPMRSNSDKMEEHTYLICECGGFFFPLMCNLLTSCFPSSHSLSSSLSSPPLFSLLYHSRNVPFLSGLNCIHIHQLLPSGHLEYVTKVMSPRKEDGPRHVVVSKDGKRVYAVSVLLSFGGKKKEVGRERVLSVLDCAGFGWDR